MDRFLFELSDMTVNSCHRALQLLDMGPSLNEEPFQLIGWHRRIMAERRPAGTEGDKLTSEFTMNLIDLAYQGRSLAMETQYLNLAVYSFGNGQHRFMDGVGRNREFLLNATEQIEGHSFKISCV